MGAIAVTAGGMAPIGAAAAASQRGLGRLWLSRSLVLTSAEDEGGEDEVEHMPHFGEASKCGGKRDGVEVRAH